jgi:hypothetical protein
VWLFKGKVFGIGVVAHVVRHLHSNPVLQKKGRKDGRKGGREEEKKGGKERQRDRERERKKEGKKAGRQEGRKEGRGKWVVKPQAVFQQRTQGLLVL